MKRFGSLTIVACVAAVVIAAAPAGAATAPLQVPGSASGPGEVGFPLDAAWQHPTFPGTSPPSTNGRYELRAPLSDGATCIRDTIVVGVAVRPANRPKLVDGTLRLHPEGSLLPRMKVERHGASGSVRWFAGPLTASHAVVDGVNPPLQQGIAVLPAPAWAARAGAARSLSSAWWRTRASSISVVPTTPAEAEDCFAPVRAEIGAQLRAVLRKVGVVRRAA
jgi:hypothetical protein